MGQVNLPDSVFGLNIDMNLIHRAFVSHLANNRQTLAHAKDRSEVRGGGTKPWRQKGTGRARHGSIRSPLWAGGGATFGPTKDRNFSVKINKKAKKKAIGMVLSSKVLDKQFLVLDDIKLDKPKTKAAMEIADNLAGKMHGYKKSKQKKDSVLLAMPGPDKNVITSFRNLPFIKTVGAASLNVKDLLHYKYLILMKDAIPIIEKTYGKRILNT